MISVVIPLFNKVDTIRRAVLSVLAQTSTDWELIVVDDGSSDGGGEAVAEIGDRRIRVIRQQNRGVSIARNTGVDAASTEIVAFLDADDYWDAGHVRNLERVVERFPDAVMFGTAYRRVQEDGAAVTIRVRPASGGSELLRLDDYFADMIEFDYPIHSSAVAVRRSVLQGLGGFPAGVSSGEDLITWARLACVGEVGYSREPTSYYVVPPVSLGQRSRVVRRPQSPDYVGDELLRLSRQVPRFRPSLYRVLGEWHRIRSMCYMEVNERADSVVEVRRAIGASGLRARDVVTLALLLLPLSLRARLLAAWRGPVRTKLRSRGGVG